MRNFKKLCASCVLALVLALPAFAGDMPGGVTAPPPPPDTSSATAQGEMQAGVTGEMGTGVTGETQFPGVTGEMSAGITGQMSTGFINPTTNIFLNLLQSLLSFF
jgi:hypothetical protein